MVINPKYEDILFFENLCIACEPEKSGPIIYSLKLKKLYTFNQKVDIFEKFNDRELRLGKKLLFNVDTHKIYPRPIDESYMEQYYGYRNNRQIVLGYNGDNNVPHFTFHVIDNHKKVISPKLLQSDTWYSEGLLPVILLDGKSGYIDEKGKLVIEVPIYNDIRTAGIRISPNLNYSFNEGIALIQTEQDVWQLVDKKGNLRKLPDEYKYMAGIFKNGLLLIQDKNQKFGFMNKNMELTIPCIFDSAESFEGKYAIVVYKGKDAIVDEKGNIYFCEDFCKQKIQER